MPFYKVIWITPPEYMNRTLRHGFGVNEELEGEAGVDAFNPGLIHKLMV